MSDESNDLADVQVAASHPVLRVVRGRPTAEELAALVVVVSAGGSSAASPAGGDRTRTSSWNDHHRAVRAPLTPGPRAWRASALPS